MKRLRSDPLMVLLVAIAVALSLDLAFMATWMADAMDSPSSTMWWGPPGQPGFAAAMLASTMAAMIVIWLVVLAVWIWPGSRNSTQAH